MIKKGISMAETNAINSSEALEKVEKIVALSLAPVLSKSLTAEQNLLYEQLYQKQQRSILKSNDGHRDKKFKAMQEERVPGNVKRVPKKKVALLMSYCGTGYHGMQLNPNIASIELDLHKALAASGAVSEENAMNPAKNAFMRCARTDKGVHAGGQVVSLKMMILDNVIDKINKCLPPQIRVWGYARVKNSFDAKGLCGSRIYEYLLPTFCLSPSMKNENAISNSSAEMNLNDIPKATSEELKEYRSYRASKETLESFKQTLKKFEGSHMFHNFTVGKSINDKSSQRYIMSISVGDPMIPVQGAGEWLSIKIHGQSFMLHQIRKMIGLVILMVRAGTGSDLILRAFEKERLNIPKAPALGLLLEKPLFDQYNSDCVQFNESRPEKDDPTTERGMIDFSPFAKEIEEFKEKWIYSGISKEEIRDSHFVSWLRIIDYSYVDYNWYLEYKEGPELDLSKRPIDLFVKGQRGEEESEQREG